MHNTERKYIGIDPGVSGGLACLDFDGKVKFLMAMPKDLTQVWNWMSYVVYSNKAVNIRAVIEKVSGYIPRKEGTPEGQHKHGGQPGSRMFTFGRSYGHLEMALVACDLKEGVGYRSIRPQDWQKALRIESRRKVGRLWKETKPQFKSRLRDTAAKLFDTVTVTLNTCDALLMAEYARRLDQGLL